MAHNVPQFGKWDTNETVPYTVYFDKARKTRGGPMINPNDPQENPTMNPPPQAKPRARQDEPIGRVIRATPDRREGDFRQSSYSPAQNENQRQVNNEVSYGGRAARGGRSSRPSMGSEQTFERSPIQQRGSVGGYDGGQGRARQRMVSREEKSPDRGAALPPFGQWDETKPESAENFTHIFEKKRKERNGLDIGNVPTTPKPISYIHTQPSKEPKKCCFPWW